MGTSPSSSKANKKSKTNPNSPTSSTAKTLSSTKQSAPASSSNNQSRSPPAPSSGPPSSSSSPPPEIVFIDGIPVAPSLDITLSSSSSSSARGNYLSVQDIKRMAQEEQVAHGKEVLLEIKSALFPYEVVQIILGYCGSRADHLGEIRDLASRQLRHVETYDRSDAMLRERPPVRPMTQQENLIHVIQNPGSGGRRPAEPDGDDDDDDDEWD